MMELPLSYTNELAKQTVFLSALLGGFSLAVIVSLLGMDLKEKIGRRLFGAAIVSASSFLVAIFAMTRIMMVTTPGYPLPITDEAMVFPRTLGMLGFLTGLVSLFVMVALSGWVKSKPMGRFTTILAIISLVLAFSMMVTVG